MTYQAGRLPLKSKGKNIGTGKTPDQKSSITEDTNMKTGLILTSSRRYLCSSPERGLLISVVYERKFFSELPQKEDDLKYGKCSFPQTLMNLYVQPGGVLFSAYSERKCFFFIQNLSDFDQGG